MSGRNEQIPVYYLLNKEKLLKPLGSFCGYSGEWKELAETISRVGFIKRIKLMH